MKVFRYGRRADPGERFSVVAPVPLSRAGESAAAVFPQRPGALDWLLGPALSELPQSEDAWQLTVSTPNAQTGHVDDSAAPALPVLVFVPGGGFVSGAGTVRWYDGDALAAAVDCVVVTVNYRLGILGHLGPEGTPAEANAPLRDLIVALEWVRDNIAAFGGDPARVRLLGESAGGWYAYALARCGAADGLFERIAMFSTPGQEPLSPEQYQASRSAVLEAFGGWAALEAAPIDRILDVQTRLVRAAPAPVPFLMPTVDDELVLPGFYDFPSAASALHSDRLLVLTAQDEAAAFIARPGAPQPPPEAIGQVIREVTREGFARPAAALAAAAEARGIVVQAIGFDLPSPVAAGRTPHGLVLPFLFQNSAHWFDAPMLEGIPSGAGAAAGASVLSAVATFVTA